MKSTVLRLVGQGYIGKVTEHEQRNNQQETFQFQVSDLSSYLDFSQ